jgi:hypothetical protein
MIRANGKSGMEYPIIKSLGSSGEMKSLVKNDVLLSFAINSPVNIVINVNPNIVIPGTMLTGLKTSMGAFFDIMEKKKSKNTGSKTPNIRDNGSLNISLKFRLAK